MTILQDIYYRHRPGFEYDVFLDYAVQNLHKLLNRKERWKLYDSYRSNKFVSDKTIHHLTTIYGKYLRFILNVNKYVTLFRKKRAKIYNSDDLMGIPLDVNNKIDVVSVYENNTHYLFSRRDLINIFYFSLTYVIEGTMITTPKHPRNPHTNLQFSSSALYTIKNFLFKRGNSMIPRVILSYFYNNYNTELVYQENIYTLNRNATKDYLFSEVTDKRKCIKLLELIYLFSGYRMNEISTKQYIQFKMDDLSANINYLHNENIRVSILGKRGFDLKPEFQKEILRKGKQILIDFYYCVFFERLIDKYNFHVLKMKIHKYIPLDDYFEATTFSFKLRQKQIIGKRYMDYMASHFINPFSQATSRRRQLARVRNAIHYEMNWSHNDISMNNIENENDDEEQHSYSDSDDL